MLELEVNPHTGLQHETWEFVLGMHFSQAVAIVQSQLRIIKSAVVRYNDQTPLAHDLILDLPGDGFRLIFDSKTQRLKLIEIYNLKLVRLKYSGKVFNGPEVIPTVHQIDHCFGATRPGTFDKERQLFVLNFLGLSFYFPVDSQFEPHYSHGLGSLRFPGESTPVVTRVIIYSADTTCENPKVPAMPLSCYRGNVYCDECNVVRNSTATRTLGLRLKLSSHSPEAVDPLEPVSFEREVNFGETVQSVMAKLGTPNKVFYKSDDKMKIHIKDTHKKVTNDKSDYFFNYFTLGIDVLFDAVCNRVIKFILHTNFPGHYFFTDYHRCPFNLSLGRPNRPGLYEISSSSATATSLGATGESPTEKVTGTLATTHISSSINTNPSPNPPSPPLNPPPPPKSNNNKSKKKNNGNNNNNNNNGKGKNQNNPEKQPPPQTQPTDLPLLTAESNAIGTGEVDDRSTSHMMSKMSAHATQEIARQIDIAWDMRWEEARRFLCQDKVERSRLEKPVVLPRSCTSNPFGPTLCYGVQDMIFEVMSNDHLASVTLYYFYEDSPT